MSLEELRKKIDEADDRLIKDIAERIKIAKEIGKEKTSSGRPIEDKEREAKVIARIRKLAEGQNINPDEVEKLYAQIMKMTKSVQGITVAFQGELGANSEAAAFQYFGSSVQVKPCFSLEDVFKAVEQDDVQFGIIPIENSLQGSISLSYDLLLESNLKVCGELDYRVVHYLIANPGVTLDRIKKVYSHPQALGQCRNFLRQINAEIVPTYDTAGSVRIIKEQGIKDGAAIASARAAEIYEMKILAEGIEDNTNNFTRFFVLAKKDSAPTGNDKTSIVFSVKHKPGSLYQFLKVLAEQNINLTKIESRPTRQKPWEYNFYLDFEGHREDRVSKEVLEKLQDNIIFLKVLGSYPKAKTD